MNCNIIVGGYGQGGAMAISMAAKFEGKLHSVYSVNGYLTPGLNLDDNMFENSSPIHWFSTSELQSKLIKYDEQCGEYFANLYDYIKYTKIPKKDDPVEILDHIKQNSKHCICYMCILFIFIYSFKPRGMDTFLSPFVFIFPLETCPFRRELNSYLPYILSVIYTTVPSLYILKTVEKSHFRDNIHIQH